MMALAQTGMRCLLVIAVLMAIAPPAGGEETEWAAKLTAGQKAYAAGHYAEAEKLFVAALAIAEQSGMQDANLAMSLYSLGQLYKAEGKYQKAEPLYKRALAIREKVLGMDHPVVATSLVTYATMLKAAHRDAEAEPLLLRAKAIREKNQK